MATRQREKAEQYEKTRDRRPTAIAKYIRIPSDKVEIVLDLIRGKKYDTAVAILNSTNKSASPVILKVLNSAAANAENNLNMVKDKLFIAECYVTQGPSLKRMMPRARGRADRILKRTCHIRVTLDEIEIKKEVKKMTTGKQLPKQAGAEKPLTDKPNAKKPNGAKHAAVKKPAAKVAAKPAAKVPSKKEGAK
jgi:large subunit ribosomal protein L22